MDDKITRWGILGVTMLMGIGYMVWLSVLYVQFMRTDAFLRSTILEHYGEQQQYGEPDSDSIDGDVGGADSDTGAGAENNGAVDADGGQAIESDKRRTRSNTRARQGTRGDAGANAP